MTVNNLSPEVLAEVNRLLAEQTQLQSRADNLHRERLNLQSKSNNELKAYLALKKEQEILEKAGIAVAQEDKEALRQLALTLDQNTQKLVEVADAQDSLNEKTRAATEALREFGVTNTDFLKKLKLTEEGTLDLTASMKSLGLSMAKSIRGGMKKTAIGLDEVNVALARQTGYTHALRQDVIDLATSHDGLYLSMGEAQKVVGGLSTGFKMYNSLTPVARKGVNKLTGNFLQMGVAAEETAAALDQLNAGFGLSIPAAATAAAEFENLAIRTGQPLSAVVSDFKDLGPQMSRFGVDGVRVFSRLNEQARTLGLTTRQAFDFSEMFDTFEGAANVAGKLNAQLGMQLNSVEMMTADSDERLKILRAEFDMRGMNFKTMGKRQKQMIADIMGTDITSASRLFGSPAEMRKFQKEQEDDAKRKKSYTTAMTKFTEAKEQFFINMAPALTYVTEAAGDFFATMNEFLSGTGGKTLSYILGIGSAGGLIWGFVKAIKALGGVSTVLLRTFGAILAPINALIDIARVFDGSSKKEKGKGWGGMIGGVLGAIAGGIMSLGNPMAIMAGYSVGSMAGSAAGGALAGGAEEVNDAVIPRGKSTLISQPGKRPIKTNRMDTISASTGDRGSLGDMNKALGEIKNLLAKSQNQKADIRLEIGGRRLDTFRDALLKPLDPSTARA